MKLPDALVRTIYDIHDDAETWLAAFPEHLLDIQDRWGLEVTGLLPDLSYNVVAYAVGADAAPYILKMSPPGEEFDREVAALGLYEGDGIAKLIRADNNVGAMLLERLQPGVSLSRSEDDEGATRIAAGLMRQLWRPVPEAHPFLPLQDWTDGLKRLRESYAGGTGPLPEGLVGRAEGIFAELVGSSPPVLLHGDLHHANILSATRQPYLAIDPKGVVGDAGYEVGAFLRNPAPDIAAHADLKGVLKRRVEILSEELGIDRRVVAAWGVAHAVLSAWWDVEDHGESHGHYQPAMSCAALLNALT